MKKIIVAGLLIFSLALNIAVAATLGWHFWLRDRFYPDLQRTESSFGVEDFSGTRKPGPASLRGKMMETRTKIMQKRAEIIDLIAKDPGNPHAADKALQELSALKGEQERQAVERISAVLASMPEEKRQAFLELLRSRTCMGPGMGMGMGRRGGHRPGGRWPGGPWGNQP